MQKKRKKKVNQKKREITPEELQKKFIDNRPKRNRNFLEKSIELTDKEKEQNQVFEYFKRKVPKDDCKEIKLEEKRNKKNKVDREQMLKIKTFFKRFFGNIKKFWSKWGMLTVFGVLVITTVINISAHFVGGKMFKDYSDYSGNEIRLNQVFDLSSKNPYYVYIYADDCNVCEKTKKDVFQYIDSRKGNPNKVKLYFFSADDFLDEIFEEEAKSVIGIKDYKDLKISSTPYLMLISKEDGESVNKVMNEWTTGQEIKKQLKRNVLIPEEKPETEEKPTEPEINPSVPEVKPSNPEINPETNPEKPNPDNGTNNKPENTKPKPDKEKTE